jgi:hypothetical protein
MGRWADDIWESMVEGFKGFACAVAIACLIHLFLWIGGYLN